MKIGILTYHFVLNEGSLMQAVCLSRLLSEACDGDVEIIDYIPSEAFYSAARRCSKPWKIRSVYKTYCSFRQQMNYIRMNSRVSPRCITSNLLKAQHFVETQKYDGIVVGSDTVWNLSPPANLPAVPNLYFAPVSRKSNSILASFAASLDPLCDSVDYEAMGKIIKPLLDRFVVLGVRDETSREALKLLNYSDTDISFVPDPTIVYGFEKILSRPLGTGEKGRAAVALIRPDLTMTISRQLSDVGFVVDDLFAAKNDRKSEDLSNLNIEGRVLRNTEYSVLVTDRFHRSIFALAAGSVRVFFLEHESKWPDPNSKGRDLFQRLGLGAHVYRICNGELQNDFIKICLAKPYPPRMKILQSIENLRQAGIKWITNKMLPAFSR